MRRYNAILETLYFPLEVLYVASLIFGISSLFLGQSFNALISINEPIILIVLDMMRALSVWLIQSFPLIFMLRASYRRQEDGLVVISGLLSYVAFHIASAFFSPNNLGLELMHPSFTMSLSATNILGSLNRTAINSGIFGSIIILIINRAMVSKMKYRSVYGFLNFVDKHVSLVFNSVALSIIAGAVAGWLMPGFIGTMQGIFEAIASNLNNPINLFAYGIVDRVVNLIGYGPYMHQQFWFGILGGTWTSGIGSVVTGDISIWTAQIAQSVYGFGAGKLMSSYAILNIFAIPAFILAAYQTYTDKLVRNRLLGFVLISIIASLLLNTLLPIELFMLINTPLVFIFHLLMTGLLFAILPSFNVFLGYAYVGSVTNVNPGTLIDVLIYLRNPNFTRPIMITLFIGLIVALLYYFVTLSYYHKGAVGLLIPNQKDVLVNELMDALGGLENIKLINASVTKVIVQVNDRNLVDFKKIHHRVHKIVETKAGYAMSYGSSSYMIYADIVARQQRLHESA